MPKSVLVIGGATIDTIIEYEEMESLEHKVAGARQAYLLLKEGEKIEVTAQVAVSGGGATNTAVSFARQGFSVSIMSKIGEDLAGEQVKRELEAEGIGTQFLVYSQEKGTGSSFVVPALSGDRTVFAYRGANTQLVPEDISDAALEQADFLYITSLSKQSAQTLPYIIEKAQYYRKPVAINPGLSQLKRGAGFLKSSLSGIEVLILNYEEAQQLMTSLVSDGTANGKHEETHLSSLKFKGHSTELSSGLFSLKSFFQEVLKLGPKVVVVTNGAEGVYVATVDAMYFQKAPKVEVVNTLGAGDAFGSSFASAYFLGSSIEMAIQNGVVNSASVIAFSDAKTGLLRAEQLSATLDKLVLDPLKTFSWQEGRLS